MLILDPDLLSPLGTIDDRLDTETLTDLVKIRLIGREPVYTNAAIFKYYLTAWLRAKKYNISKLIDTTLFEYNPIDNYDRIEEGQRTGETKRQGAETRTDDLHTTEDTTLDKTAGVVNSGQDATKNKGTNTSTENVSAYDQEGYSPKNQNVIGIDTTSTIIYGGKTDSSGKDTTVKTVSQTGTVGTESSGTDNSSEKYQNHMHGNIGVTTTQQMIQQERDIVLFNIYEWIVDRLDREMFLGVWN